MTRDEFVFLIDLPPNASNEQIEAAYAEKKANLEDFIFNAPSDQLSEKYTNSLVELIAGYDVFTTEVTENGSQDVALEDTIPEDTIDSTSYPDPSESIFSSER